MATSKPKDSQESEAQPETVKVIRYVGSSNYREITEEQFAAIGITHHRLYWERDAPLNDVRLSDVQLDPQDFSRCILADPDFRVIELSR